MKTRSASIFWVFTSSIFRWGKNSHRKGAQWATARLQDQYHTERDSHETTPASPQGTNQEVRNAHTTRRASSASTLSLRDGHGTPLVSARRSFTQMDSYLFHLLWQWGKRRHPNKSGAWRAKTSCHPEQGRWQFASSERSLRLHRQTPIKRYVKVQGTKSPFDGDWIYWTKRQGSHPETPPKMAYLLKSQKGKGALSVDSGSKMEIGWKLTIVFLLPSGVRTSMSISNFCIDIATIKRLLPMGCWWSEVLMTTAKRLRSRMR